MLSFPNTAPDRLVTLLSNREKLPIDLKINGKFILDISEDGTLFSYLHLWKIIADELVFCHYKRWVMILITLTSNERHGDSNHRQLYRDCLFKTILLNWNLIKHYSLIYWWYVRVNGGFPHKDPIMRKAFPYHDVPMPVGQSDALLFLIYSNQCFTGIACNIKLVYNKYVLYVWVINSVISFWMFLYIHDLTKGLLPISTRMNRWFVLSQLSHNHRPQWRLQVFIACQAFCPHFTRDGTHVGIETNRAMRINRKNMQTVLLPENYCRNFFLYTSTGTWNDWKMIRLWHSAWLELPQAYS